MNERYRQLIEEAYEYAHKNSTGDWQVGRNLVDVFNKKFAELIVKECMTICEDVAERNDPAIACYYEIKRKFWS